jgi:hypothetical protein
MGLILIILFLMFGVPALLAMTGFSRRKQNKDSAKVFYILAVVWLIVAGGICATILNSLSFH